MRVRAHHHQIIVPLLDLLSKRFMFLGGPDVKNVGSDFNSVMAKCAVRLPVSASSSGAEGVIIVTI